MTPHRRRFLLVLFVACLLMINGGCGGGGGGSENAVSSQRQFPLSSLSRSLIQINGSGGVSVPLYVLNTPEKRGEGMMFLAPSDFADSDGMLFVYTAAQPMSFYMKNTGIPLDIAFVSADGTVNSTYALRPFDLTPVQAAANSQFALEMKQGAFQRLGIANGTKLLIPSDLAPASRAAAFRSPKQKTL